MRRFRISLPTIGRMAEVPPSSEQTLIVRQASRKNVNISEANMINWKALDNVPILLYILALKTLLLCLAFAGVKIYQGKKEEEAMKRQQAERRRLAEQTPELMENLKED